MGSLPGFARFFQEADCSLDEVVLLLFAGLAAQQNLLRHNDPQVRMAVRDLLVETSQMLEQHLEPSSS